MCACLFFKRQRIKEGIAQTKPQNKQDRICLDALPIPRRADMKGKGLLLWHISKLLAP